ncbi:hypothetical protein GS934_02320 [Rhodococcus hoagii]|nr:hypothetical protein [Prescottella equi]NKZ86926.1 hypothetical protein [Prescottella equi]
MVAGAGARATSPGHADARRFGRGPRRNAAERRSHHHRLRRRRDGGDEATCLLDGRRVSASGAALANGTVMNAVDYDDGHALAKGHPGAVIIPAALAAAEATGAGHEEFLLATLIGYEVGIRAAIAQHDRWPLFHSSGTWGAVGAAAACARLLKLSPTQVDAALGWRSTTRRST